MSETNTPSSLLLVDDNEMNRDMLSRRLERKGYQVMAVAGGKEALQVLEHQSFDLILLDIMMPDISGLEVLRSLREKDSLLKQPVIMVSAKDQSDDIVTALALGANDYITKPIDFPVALARIQTQVSRKKMAQALQESEERFRDLFENASDLIQSVGLDGRILYVNQAWKDALGYDDADIPQLLMWDILAPEQIPHCQGLFQQLMSGVTIPKVETVFVSRDGHSLIVEGNINCRFEDGKPVATRGIFRDITAQKQMQRLKNEFVSMVSHELRTPLTSIGGALGLLLGGMGGELPATAQHLLEVANRNCERLIRLVNDILDIEKIESGKMDFTFKPVNLNSLVTQTLEANKSFAEQQGIQFKFEPSQTDWTVRGDSDRLMQVLTNLLSNAAKFSPAQSMVEVTIHSQDGLIRVAITDHGPGIPDAFRHRIFQKFSQADSSDTRPKGGSGLGLNISKAIVEQHDGHIGFESVVGQGSTFYFDLPEYKQGASE